MLLLLLLPSRPLETLQQQLLLRRCCWVCSWALRAV
jgi:hypothetical protein